MSVGLGGGAAGALWYPPKLVTEVIVHGSTDGGVWVGGWVRKWSSAGCGTAGSFVSGVFEGKGLLEDEEAEVCLYGWFDAIGVVWARCHSRMLSARLLAAASESDGERCGVDLCSSGKRGRGPVSGRL